MWACVSVSSIISTRILRCCRGVPVSACSSSFLPSWSLSLGFPNQSSSFASFAQLNEKIRILRHFAIELNLNMRSDGYVKVQDLLKLNLKTFAQIPLRLHTVDDIREAVRRDDKQRFSLIEESGELLIRANQGHTIMTLESESLLKPILSAEEVPVCVHGTFKENLVSILEYGLKRMKRLHVHFSCGLPTDGQVISGMRPDVNVLIFLNVRKALEDGMKIYISENKVILTEGFDGVVPVHYFEKIESWPDRRPIPLY